MGVICQRGDQGVDLARGSRESGQALTGAALSGVLLCGVHSMLITRCSSRGAHHAVLTDCASDRVDQPEPITPAKGLWERTRRFAYVEFCARGVSIATLHSFRAMSKRVDLELVDLELGQPLLMG